jgi:hypothetical protein
MEIPSDMRLPNSHAWQGIHDKAANGWLPLSFVDQEVTGWLARFK